jgi:diguanylate cyclase (GGDEF)-like protein/PAS domain S-box-containing protein
MKQNRKTPSRGRGSQTISKLKAKTPEHQALDADCEERIAKRTAELEAANAALRESEAHYRTIFESSESPMLIVEEDMTVSLANAKVELLTGYLKSEILGAKMWTDIIIPEDRERMKGYYVLRRKHPHAGPQRYEFRIRDKMGVVKEIYSSVALIPGTRKSIASLMDVTNLKKAERDMRKRQRALSYATETSSKEAQDSIAHVIPASRDLSAQRLLEERLNHLAYYDGLTGLPNRTLFLDRIKQEVPRTEYRKRHVAVLAVNIDRFSCINETFGADCGDEVLREVGRRLSSAVREGDTVARFGRDHFGIALVDVAQSQDIIFVVSKIFSALERPIRISETDITVAVYIGISVSPQDSMDASVLVENSEVSMVKSRERGLNTYYFFTADLNRMASHFAELQKSLYHALKNNEFVLHYQPYFNIGTKKLAGIECLIRWNSPEHGFIYPSDFIPALEDTRMIIHVGQWVLKEACSRIREWQDKGYDMVPVTTNISAVQFKQADVGDFLETTIKKSGIDPKNLAFELTESAMMQNPDRIRSLLTRLKKLGISISTDDFGTGYSSLSYLKNLPLDNLKIDISFVRDITKNKDDRAIVSSIVSMAHNLRLKTIAEGVETEEQLNVLHRLGCDMVQGFYLSRPMPAETVEALLAKNQ